MSPLIKPRVRYVRTYSEVVVPHGPPQHLNVLHRCEDGDCVPFVPLVRFFLDGGMSGKLSTQRKYATSVQLLLDHLAAYGKTLADAGPEDLQQFVDRLVCDPTDEAGRDPSGLYWQPVTVEVAATHLQRVSIFSDWLVRNLGYRALNPWGKATSGERRRALHRFEQRAARSFLSHAAVRRDELQRADRARSVAIRQAATCAFDDVHAFDDEGFQRLLDVGWGWRPTQRETRHHRLRDTLISILLHCCGLRLSEVFHLYVGDVREHPTQPGHALVHLFHPEQGEAPIEPGGPWRDRTHYLHDRWQMLPRTRQAGRFHAGWKNNALTAGRRKAAHVWFFGSDWGAVFWRLYAEYLAVRPNGQHPFLFASEARAEKGKPYTKGAFQEAHRRAVKRAGLDPGRHHGTNPHAHRHAVALALSDAGLPSVFIQRVLRHRNVLSQEAYKIPSAARVTDALEHASPNRSVQIPANLRDLS